MSRPTFRYVPALDGVRALSVVAILLFHSPLLWARGGFLGVSVFFTLSGFLITSLLLSERERTGRISLKAFWVRRARRLAPAVLVLFGLVAALLATGSIGKRDSLLGDAVATAGWGANWRFIFSGQSYAEIFGQPSPFQHMWSLAVEEQFYLFFPGLLLLLLGRSERAKRWRAGLFVVAGISVSTALLWVLFEPGASERAYYGTDSRMAEPFVGVLLALLLTRGGAVRALPRAVGRLLDIAALGALAGLGYLVWSWGQYTHTLYHGGLLLVAALTAVLLAAVTQPGSLLGWVLALPPLSWIGKISYGVYVYHWPVFLWLTPDRTGLTTYRLLALRCAVVLAVAAVSYVLIEQPIRQARGFRVAFAVPAWANATVVAMAALVLATGTIATPQTSRASDEVTASGVAPKPKQDKPKTPTAVKQPKPTLVNPKPGPTRPPRVGVVAPRPVGPTKPATRPSSAAPRPTSAAKPKLRIAVIGDSLAEDLGEGLLAWSRGRTDVVTKNFSYGACPIALGGMRRWPDGYEASMAERCWWFMDHNSTRWKEFQAFNPQVIVMQDGMNELVERKLEEWNDYHVAGEPMFDSWMKGEFEHAFDVFNPRGGRTLLLLNAVCADWNRVNHFQGFQLELDRRVTALNANYSTMSAPGMAYVDFRAHLCPNGRYSDEVDGVENGRYDGYHLTEEASLALATRWLGPLCIDAAKR